MDKKISIVNEYLRCDNEYVGGDATMPFNERGEEFAIASLREFFRNAQGKGRFVITFVDEQNPQ